MRAIDAALLLDLAQGGEAGLVEEIAPLLARELVPAGIDSPLRRAHFLAQAAYETWRFTRLEEKLDYSAERIAEVWPRLRARAFALAHDAQALANAAYANLNGNGPEAGGDGWRFRGRGLFQLTGRANYARAGCDSHPDGAAEPEGAVASAIAFWRARQLDEPADRDDAAALTRRLNGGENGLAERTLLKRRALALLASQPASA